MESPVSRFVCKIEQIAIETAPHKSLWWFRYVNNTHTKLKKQQAQEFTDHLNSLDPDIKFTTEGEEDRALVSQMATLKSRFNANSLIQIST